MARSEGQKESQKHERRLEKAFDGQRNAASGAFWSRKGDVRSVKFLIEHKWTAKKSFTIKASDLEKICEEAILDGRTPVLGFHLNGRNYVILEEPDLLSMSRDGI